MGACTAESAEVWQELEVDEVEQDLARTTIGIGGSVPPSIGGYDCGLEVVVYDFPDFFLPVECF